MQEKDITEKSLEEYADVFSDIVNVLLFQGKRLIGEDELETETPGSGYKAGRKLHAQERDVAKFWRKGQVRIALFGLENQTKIDADMPLRLFSYDGAAYRAQLLADKKDKKTGRRRKSPRYPVVTLVLYFGYKRHWKKKTLYECLKIPKELRPYVNDYRMNLYEIAYLSDEQVQMFQSDFRIVADYFVQMRKNNDYQPSKETIMHVHEVLQMLAVMTRDNRFEEACNQEEKGEATNMCEVLDRVENRGIRRGDMRRIVSQICKKIMKGKTLEAIAEDLEETPENIRHIYQVALKHAPEYDVDEIVNELLPEDAKVAV